MYNYVLNGEESKICVMKGEEKVCEMNIFFVGNKAWIDMIELSDEMFDEMKKENNCMQEYVRFMDEICENIKETLTSKGLKVEKVLCGSFSEVKAYEMYLKDLEKELTEENTVKFSNMR